MKSGAECVRKKMEGEGNEDRRGREEEELAQD